MRDKCQGSRVITGSRVMICWQPRYPLVQKEWCSQDHSQGVGANRHDFAHPACDCESCRLGLLGCPKLRGWWGRPTNPGAAGRLNHPSRSRMLSLGRSQWPKALCSGYKAKHLNTSISSPLTTQVKSHFPLSGYFEGCCECFLRSSNNRCNRSAKYYYQHCKYNESKSAMFGRT